MIKIKKNWRRLFVVLSIGSFLYAIFYIIFYIFLASLSVDGLIGISIVFLFCIIYRFGGIYIDRYLLSISRNVWLFFVNLVSLTYMIKRLFIKMNDSYKRLMVYQFFCNHLVFVELNKVFNEFNVMLLNKYVLNVVLSELFYKRLVIKNLFDKNSISSEMVIFFDDSLDIDAYLLNNTIGWLKE